MDTLILTPTLGNRSSIERTIEAIRRIGSTRVKHVLIAPENVVKALAIQYSDVEVIPEPIGCVSLYQALNCVFLENVDKYQYFGYINDDDFWLDDFRKLFSALDTDSTIDIVYGRVNYIDENGESIGEQTCSPRHGAFEVLLKSNIVLFTQQATLFRSTIYSKVGGFDEQLKLIADTKFWLSAIALKAKLKYVNAICASYMYHDNQLTSNHSLLVKEHQYLVAHFSSTPHLKILFEKFLFRLYNANIYFNRFFNLKYTRNKLKYR